MAYGHADRNLALIHQLEAETRKLLEGLDQLTPEQSAWLRELAGQAGGFTRTGPKQQRPLIDSARAGLIPR